MHFFVIPIALLADSLFGFTVRAMWDHVITRLTIGLNVETVTWTVGHRPPKLLQLAQWERLLPTIALRLIGELRSGGYLDGVLGLLGDGVVTPQVDMTQRTELIRWMITDGRLISWRGLPALVVPEMADKPGEVSYSYTKPKIAPVAIGHEVAHKPANPKTNTTAQDVPVAVFAGTGYTPKQGIPNGTDDSCPALNYRSESTTTCSPEVTKWFGDKSVQPQYRDSTLGYDGGGGFERTKATVRHLIAGTPLYRYVDYASWPYGAWWFLEPLDGDPCVLAALPPDSAATVMVQAKLKRGVDVLFGPGAPRCTNKPGGPNQVFVARCDYLPEEGDILDIVA